MKIHEIANDCVLLDLEPTRYSLMVNKWELYRYLLDGKLKRIHFEVEDFDNITKEELIKLTEDLKENDEI